MNVELSDEELDLLQDTIACELAELVVREEHPRVAAKIEQLIELGNKLGLYL